MNEIIYKWFNKLFVKQWVIGIAHVDIKDIIRTKSFDPPINWLPLESINHFQADPFPMRTKDGNLNIFYENFIFDDFYGTISIMTLDHNLKPIKQKFLLDTKSHLSYPFFIRDDNKIYMFPEAAHSGKLSCFEYDPVHQSLSFLKVIMDLPVLDPTILKHDGKYWLFGTLLGKDSHRKLYIYFSKNLLGPYTPHPENPVKNSLNGSRPAGNFIEIEGVYYRPSQNCENQYGESITINKINKLNELSFEEEPYMVISINKKRHSNSNIFTIHTINVKDDIIAVDGLKWTFSPKDQWRNFLSNRKYFRSRKGQQKEY